MAKTGGKSPQSKLSSRLQALTQDNISLRRALERLLAQNKTDSLEFLATIKPDEWLELAYEHGTPDGSTPAAYAEALASRVEELFSTATLAVQLAKGGRLSRVPALKGVALFLRDHPAFDIVTANLNATTRLADARGTPPSPELVTGLRSLQRLNQLGASWEETAALMENDLESPAALLAAGPTDAATRLDGRIKPDRILFLYQRAKTRPKSRPTPSSSN